MALRRYHRQPQTVRCVLGMRGCHWMHRGPWPRREYGRAGPALSEVGLAERGIRAFGVAEDQHDTPIRPIAW